MGLLSHVMNPIFYENNLYNRLNVIRYGPNPASGTSLIQCAAINKSMPAQMNSERFPMIKAACRKMVFSL